MPVIRFEPSGRSVSVPESTPLLDACRLAGFRIPTPCGGKGLCGKCGIKISGGGVPADAAQSACVPRRRLEE